MTQAWPQGYTVFSSASVSAPKLWPLYKWWSTFTTVWAYNPVCWHLAVANCRHTVCRCCPITGPLNSLATSWLNIGLDGCSDKPSRWMPVQPAITLTEHHQPVSSISRIVSQFRFLFIYYERGLSGHWQCFRRCTIHSNTVVWRT